LSLRPMRVAFRASSTASFTAPDPERRSAAASLVAADIGRSSRNTEECDMVTYVGLMSFTEKGIQSVKETTKRAAAAKELAKKAGVNMKEILWTMGEYDLVCVLEAEDEQALAAFSLGVAMQGNVRARSLRAYTAGEMDKILAKLP
jgi:uncharacterized protein with GYD domain